MTTAVELLAAVPTLCGMVMTKVACSLWAWPAMMFWVLWQAEEGWRDDSPCGRPIWRLWREAGLVEATSPCDLCGRHWGALYA